MRIGEGVDDVGEGPPGIVDLEPDVPVAVETAGGNRKIRAFAEEGRAEQAAVAVLGNGFGQVGDGNGLPPFTDNVNVTQDVGQA